jgi:hypothetical protein
MASAHDNGQWYFEYYKSQEKSTQPLFLPSSGVGGKTDVWARSENLLAKYFSTERMMCSLQIYCQFCSAFASSFLLFPNPTMGCTASKATSNTNEIISASKFSYNKIINDNCPHIRLDHSGTKKTLPITGNVYNYQLSYVYVSQRGYYPNGLNSFLPSSPSLSSSSPL